MITNNFAFENLRIIEDTFPSLSLAQIKLILDNFSPSAKSREFVPDKIYYTIQKATKDYPEAANLDPLLPIPLSLQDLVEYSDDEEEEEEEEEEGDEDEEEEEEEEYDDD